jgi:hypothetical protein
MMANTLRDWIALVESEKAPTIASATGRGGQINRKTADRILDPKGYFEKNKRRNFGRRR